ncbi:MAG: protein phosphatase CheZ [Desulfovibrio sp.]|nr:protein phosphatase CheZ [Desulfovibrio sp.]
MADQNNNPAVFRQLSSDMRQGLKDIYQQISTASNESVPASGTDALFHEASDDLDEVLRATETAAMNIMEVVEKHLDLQAESAQILQALRNGNLTENLDRLEAINSQLGNDLTGLLTALSFQDITGQRIKRVMRALGKIEDSVVELYVSSGLIIDAAEKHPHKDAQTLKDEASRAVEDFRQSRQGCSSLKGPSKDGISQNAIDDMLAQLGL